MSIEHSQAVVKPESAMPGRIVRALFNTLASTVGFAIAVIVPARAWGWVRGWVMVAVFLVLHVIGTLRLVRANPDLLRERARLATQPGRPIADKVLLLAFTASYAGMLVFSSADATRWHIWSAPPAAAAWAGLALFAAGLAEFFDSVGMPLSAKIGMQHLLTLIVHYVTRIRKLNCTHSHIHTALRKIGVGTPSDLGARLRDVNRRMGYINASNGQDVQLTIKGENWIDIELPKRQVQAKTAKK